MEKIKISNHQLFSLTAICAIGGTSIVASSLAVRIAKQDAWIGALLAPLISMPLLWIYWFLGSRYPDMTLTGIIKKIFGKWVGVIFSIGFIFFYATTSSRILWYVGDFVTSQNMTETPGYVVNLLFITAVAIAVLYGLEVIARASELFIYFASGLFILAMILVLPGAKIVNLLPVFEKGIVPALKTLIPIESFMTFPLISLISVFSCNVVNISKAKKPIFAGYMLSSFVVFISILMSILVIGSGLTACMRYPVYMVAEEINVGSVFTRLEFIVATSWIITELGTELLLFYACVIEISELLRLRDHKKIVIPLALVILVMSEILYPNVAYQINWSGMVWIPYSATYGLIIPVLLLLVFLVKKWVFKRT